MTTPDKKVKGTGWYSNQYFFKFSGERRAFIANRVKLDKIVCLTAVRIKSGLSALQIVFVHILFNTPSRGC